MASRRLVVEPFRHEPIVIVAAPDHPIALMSNPTLADIAAADVAIRKRTAHLRALRLAKEAADGDKPAEPKPKKKKSPK